MTDKKKKPSVSDLSKNAPADKGENVKGGMQPRGGGGGAGETAQHLTYSTGDVDY